jgi:hypothetical protein
MDMLHKREGTMGWTAAYWTFAAEILQWNRVRPMTCIQENQPDEMRKSLYELRVRMGSQVGELNLENQSISRHALACGSVFGRVFREENRMSRYRMKTREWRSGQLLTLLCLPLSQFRTRTMDFESRFANGQLLRDGCTVHLQPCLEVAQVSLGAIATRSTLPRIDTVDQR